MTAADPRRVEEVFDAALERTGEARAPFLDAACAGDAALREEVNTLLLRDDGLEREPRDPSRVGRFEVVRKIGQGGMGVVYEAHDATLDRRVALKLVRLADDGTTVARERLLREAQAMAKVADPHVVPVYEVGEHGDEVFVAMELVEGETLSAWLGRVPRSWRDVLGMYVGAGRGLVAAHARGIVHRDFKPDNVLIGADGRARVLDFGLARVAAGTTTSTGSTASTADAEGVPADAGAELPPSASLTVTGAIMGTPGYMSPEHFRAQGVDARSDQFCFAIALYRGLFGVAPFEGTTFLVLGDNVCSGNLRPPPAGEVPASVVQAVVRALSPEPEARFPSMEALLAELERPLRIDPDLDPGRGRRGRRLAVVLMATLATLTLPVVVFFEPPELKPAGIVLHAVVGLVALGVLGIVFRRAFRASAHNRRLGLAFLVPCVGFVIHRLVAVHFDAPVAETLVGDALGLGAVCVIGGLTMERWMFVGAPLAVVYTGLVVVFPRHAVTGFGLLVLVIFTTAAALWGEPRMRVRKKKSDGVSGSSSGSRTTG